MPEDAAITRGHGNVLNVVRRIRNYAALDAVTQIHVDENLARLGVDRVEKTANFSGENEIGSRNGDSGD